MLTNFFIILSLISGSTWAQNTFSTQLQEAIDYCGSLTDLIGMISHKKSLITIVGQKHKIKNFIKKFDIFHREISTAFDFGLYLE